MGNLGKAGAIGAGTVLLIATLATAGAGSLLLFGALAGGLAAAGLGLADPATRKAATSASRQGVRAAFTEYDQARADAGKPRVAELPRVGSDRLEKLAVRTGDWGRGRVAAVRARRKSPADTGGVPPAHRYKVGDRVHWVEEDPDLRAVYPDAQDEGVVEIADPEDPEHVKVRWAGAPDRLVDVHEATIEPGLLPTPPADSDAPEHRWRRAYLAAWRRNHPDPRAQANREMDRPQPAGSPEPLPPVLPDRDVLLADDRPDLAETLARIDQEGTGDDETEAHRVAALKRLGFEDNPPASPPVPERAAADREKRFRELRDSGYKGHIDQDGHAVPDLDSWINDQTRGGRRYGDRDTPPDPADPERTAETEPPVGTPEPNWDDPVPGAGDSRWGDWDPWTESIPVTTTTTDEPTDSTTSTEETDMAGNIQTDGKGFVAGLIADWETSQEARLKPETFIAWLQQMGQGTRYAGGVVEQLIQLFHGRGPTGHAGVPENILQAFTASFAESLETAAVAYDRFAADYAAYVEAAEAEMVASYGKEVVTEASQIHQGSGGTSSAAAA